LKSQGGQFTSLDKWLTKFFYRQLDRVVFYTEKSKALAVQQNFIPISKAYWANNTLDNTEIEKYYQFVLPDSDTFSILFIGRLIPSKRIDLLLRYYHSLKSVFPKKKLELKIIGDGPDSNLVKHASDTDNDIHWYGTLVDESVIAPLMRKANVVFVPGLSGLSINHALLYGRPYLTFQSDYHGPEIHYLEHGINGLILSGDFQKDSEKLGNLINHPRKINEMALASYEKGKELSIQNWVNQMKKALNDA
ncbi:MAG: glycosyltransferase family 4 protein, partial [Cyclobacteriaceae bacterium]|nr:glycosyltransferase family 4 protein [Cyclobacteriaceae bacterium]